MGFLTREQLDDLAYCEPDLCQNCVFFTLRNGSGFGCSHPEVDDYLRGEVLCYTKLFKPLSNHGYRPPK